MVKGTRIVTPMMFRPEILKLLHEDSHLGIDKCIQRTKESVYWPGISENVKHSVKKCAKCLENCRHNQKEPYISFDIPIIAWKTVATDLFFYDSKCYLLVIDFFARFPVVRLLPNETTKFVLNCLKLIC